MQFKISFETWRPAYPYPSGGEFRNTLEIHPEIHVREQRERPAYSTCWECHHAFHAKSEDQVCLELCDSCFRALRSLREPGHPHSHKAAAAT